MKRICASSWTITKNHCMMHGQQNVKFWKSYCIVVIFATETSSLYGGEKIKCIIYKWL